MSERVYCEECVYYAGEEMCSKITPTIGGSPIERPTEVPGDCKVLNKHNNCSYLNPIISRGMSS